MNKIPGLAELHQMTYGHATIKIAVLDGPVDLKHACFQSASGRFQPLNKQSLGTAKKGLALTHGTAVTSLIFAQPESTVEGIAPKCSGLLLPIFSDEKDGQIKGASQVILANAIKTAVEKGAHIINISGGQFSKLGTPDFFLQQAIEMAREAGVLIVAATGNEGCDCLHVPAADENVLAVGSMDNGGEPTPQTNFGDLYQTHGILAPGKGRIAAQAGGGTFQTNGATSYATPIVSGIVGLMMSLQIQEGIEPDAYLVKSILEQTAIPCTGDSQSEKCKRLLRGRLNLPAALQVIQQNPAVLASGLQLSHKNKPSIMKNHSIQAIDVLPSNTPVANNLSNETEQVTTIQSQEKLPEAGANMAKVVPATASFNSIHPSKIKNMENQNVNLADISQLQSSSIPTSSELVTPSDCGCGGDNPSKGPALVYALGTIGYDFGSLSHKDSINQSMGYVEVLPPTMPPTYRKLNPDNPNDMIIYLKKNPTSTADLIWTLSINATPIYALTPQGAYSAETYTRILEFFESQTTEINTHNFVLRSSFPGISGSSQTLLSGLTVPLLLPKLRGMFNWSIDKLVEALIIELAIPATEEAEFTKAMIEFLEKIYYQLRNQGITSAERALNYAGTNVIQVGSIIKETIDKGLRLNTITVSPSPICSPGLDCQDVVLTFFNPTEVSTVARQVYRFTIDVSDVVPVTMGQIVHWPEF